MDRAAIHVEGTVVSNREVDSENLPCVCLRNLSRLSFIRTPYPTISRQGPDGPDAGAGNTDRVFDY